MKNTTATALLMAALTVASMLAGCGKSSPASTTSKLPSRAPFQSTYPPAGYGQSGYGMPGYGMQPGMGQPGMGQPGNAQQILAAVRQAQQAQTGFQALIDTYEKGPDGSTENEELQIWYKRPSTLKIHIVKGTGQAQDCQVLWDGSSNMKVKPSFMPFAVGVGISDSRVVSKNGWTIKETDVSCILGVLLDPGAQVTPLGIQNIDGKTVNLLEVHSPKSPHGVTVERIGVDLQTNLPTVRMMFKGQTMAYKLVAKSMKLGVPSSDNLSL